MFGVDKARQTNRVRGCRKIDENEQIEENKFKETKGQIQNIKTKR